MPAEPHIVRVASLKHGRDGKLVAVARDLTRAVAVPGIAATLQDALDDWASLHSQLASVCRLLDEGLIERSDGEPVFAFDPRACTAPLPRAPQFADGSAYLNHVELVRKARGAAMPPEFYSDPLMYQGLSDGLLGPHDDVRCVDEAHGIDFEAEVAVITDDVPMAVTPDAARAHIKLVLLVNDVSLRNLIPAELAKGFGFFQSKPASSFSAVALTPEALGAAWRDARLHLPLRCDLNGERFGAPDAGADMNFDFGQLIAHAARTRALGAGTIIGSGTVSNRDPAAGSACIAERRTIETIRDGKPSTPFMKFGDRVRIDMRDAAGTSPFGAIDQQIVRYAPPR